MPQPVRLLGLSGSIRQGSNCTAILRAVADNLGERGTLTIHDLRAIPLYDGDLDGEVKPEPVRALKEAIAAADGVVLITPEYNYGMSGVLKNALDWASRPAFKSPFKGKPVLPMTSSGGLFGGVRAMSGMVDTLTGMLCRLAPSPHVSIPQAGAKVKDGKMEDAQTLTLCLAGVDALIGEIELLRKAA